jgi:hypothetical protein
MSTTSTEKPTRAPRATHRAAKPKTVPAAKSQDDGKAQRAADVTGRASAGTPAEANGAAKPDKRSSKQALARAVVQAAADLFANISTRPTGEDDAQTMANWLHHLPTGTTEGGQRWWPTTLPKPQRSDWK